MAKWLWVCDDLLSEEECSRMLEHFKERPLETIDNGVAAYNRGILKDEALAAEVFSRIREKIAEEFGAAGCNEVFRFSEYETGGEFKMHRDGRNQDAQGRRSVITVNIFLNEEFTGGSTDFYLDDKQTLRESVKARRGRAAVFDAQQYHVGAKVEAGRKYLLRTDVMAELGME